MRFWRYVLMVLFVASVFVVLHEHTHYVIFHEFGCTDVGFGAGQVNLSGKQFLGFYTHADCSNVEDIGALNLAHAINEVVGYNVMVALIFIIFMKLAAET